MGREVRRQAITALHRENIISAAEELFASKGYESTTVDDIAHAAEYSKRTIYAYFGSKYDIYCHIVLKGFSLLKEHISQSLRVADDCLAQYHSLCRSLTAFYREHPLYFNGVVMFQTAPEQEEAPPEVTREIFTVGEEINGILFAWMDGGKKQGLVRPEVDARQAIFIYWASLASVIAVAHNKKSYIEQTMGVSQDQFLKYGFDLLFKAIMN